MIRASVASMSGYVPGEQPDDPRVIKLNTNENPYPPSPRVGEALRVFDPSCCRLYPDPVCRELRERIARKHGCDPAQVFVGNGSDEVLALCTRAFVENDGSIGYFDPSYSLYPILTDIRDVEKRPVDLGDGFSWRMPDGYAASLFFLTNPNAPTGMLFPRKEVEAFCGQAAGVVVIDEAYVDFARADCVDLALSLPNVLVARTLSKSYSLAGLRLGYALGAVPLVDALYKIKDSYNIDMLTQALGCAAVADEETMRCHVDCIRTTRERLLTELAALGFGTRPSDANFVWVTPPAAIAAADLFRQLRDDGIFVRYFPGEKTGDFIRITIGTDEQIDALLAWLKRKLV